MSIDVHPSSVVHPKAELAEGVVIGPFCTVGPDVKIGARTKLFSHVVIDGVKCGITRQGWTSPQYPFNLTGHPAVTLPSGALMGVSTLSQYCGFWPGIWLMPSKRAFLPAMVCRKARLPRGRISGGSSPSHCMPKPESGATPSASQPDLFM